MTSPRYLTEPGIWFAVPLPSGGWMLGLVARVDGRKRAKFRKVFAYFFGPVVDDPAAFGRHIVREPNDRVFWAQTSDMGLRDGSWREIERMAEFRLEDWPMPSFRRPAGGGGPDWRRRYLLVGYDDTLKRQGPEEEVLLDDLRSHPDDALHGHIALEHALERALAGLIV